MSRPVSDNGGGLTGHWRQATFCVLDLETTGMDPARDQIIAAGALIIEGGRIVLSTAWQSLAALEEGTTISRESVPVHGLVAADLTGAPPLRQLLSELLDLCSGGLVVAHMGLRFDRPFIEAACNRLGLPRPELHWLDTALLGAWFDDNPAISVPAPRGQGPQRLADLVARYALPQGQAHDALGDALSAAQLFLVLATKAEAIGRPKVSDLLRMI